MTSYLLFPDVPGGIGEESVIDRSGSHIRIVKFHFVLDGWPYDDLLECFPEYIVTQRLGDNLTHSHLTGFSVAPVSVTKSGIFIDLYGDIDVPSLYWLKIHGKPVTDDFAFIAAKGLIISESAMGKLARFHLDNCRIKEIKD